MRRNTALFAAKRQGEPGAPDIPVNVVPLGGRFSLGPFDIDGSGQTTVGKSMKIRDLSSADVQKQTDSDLQKIIADGKGKMTGFKAKLSVADISSLVAYIRGLAKK